jgi:hypothetical protein
MQRNVVSQVEEDVLIIRHAPRSRPRSPRRRSWQGPLPHGVEGLVEREALDQYYSQSYAKWASSFAGLADEFIGRIVKGAPQMAIRPLEWTCYKFVDCCSCKVDENYLWVQKHDSGWTIELCYPDATDPDSFVLTVEHMPIPCPDRRSAVSLAVACYPKATANLAWDPYW